MKIRSILNLKLISIILLSFQSCQPLLKAYTGVKTPELEMENTDRLKYYNPFLETTNYAVKIYTFNDINTLKSGFNTIQSYPFIILKNNITNALYKLDCYEDLDLYVEDINSENYKDLLKIKPEELSPIVSFIENESELVYSKNKPTNNLWDIYLVSGSFLGKKLRKKTIPITNIKTLNSLFILDLSVNIK